MSFTPHIFINTEFKRTNQSIVSLVALHHQRIIEIEDDLVSIPNIIRSHHSKNGSSIGLWGDIVNYKYFTAHGECTVFNVSGEIVGTESFRPSCTDEPAFLVQS